MARYTLAVANTDTGTVSPVVNASIAPGASVGAAVHEWYSANEATSPNYGYSTGLARLTGGTPVTSQTPEKMLANSQAATAAGVVDYGTTSPTASGGWLIRAGAGVVNPSTGGVQRRWNAHPRFPIVLEVSTKFGAIINDFGTPYDRFLGVSEPHETPIRVVNGRRPSQRGYFMMQDGGQGKAGALSTQQLVNAHVWVEPKTWWQNSYYNPMNAAIQTEGSVTASYVAIPDPIYPHRRM